MIKSKKGTSGVEFGEFIIPGAIMLAIVLIGAGFYYGFFTSEPLKEIKSEGGSIIDQIVEPIKKDISAKGSKDPKTNAEEAFDEVVNVVKTFSFNKNNGLIRLKDIDRLGQDYAIYLGDNNGNFILNLYNKETSKFVKNVVFENKNNVKFGFFNLENEYLLKFRYSLPYLTSEKQLNFNPSRVAFYTNTVGGKTDYEIKAFDTNVKDFKVSALPVLGYRVVGNGKTKDIQIGWILGLNAEETLKYFNKN